MNKTPSTILSDALTSFNRAATLAFTAAQDQARKDATQAATDAREARRERDEAVSALHASRLEEQAWKQEANAWKAAANQAELTVNHHLETIAQLRQEATQWKNQCLRLEETSRQEAISWKEQFLRVEQERTKLAQRAEELVAEQLSGSGGHPQTFAAPYTPIPRYSVIGDSTRLQGSSSLDSLSPGLQELPPSKSAPSMHKKTSNPRTRPGHKLQLPTPLSENQRSARQRTAQGAIAHISQPGSTPNGTRQIFVRRVHAVVEVPVKEESVEQDRMTLDTRAPPSASTSISAVKAPTRTAGASKAALCMKRRPSSKRSYVEIDEGSEKDDAGHDSQQSDAEYQPVSDGDDELLMGIETNRKEVYGMKRTSNPISFQKTTRPLIVAKRRRAPPTKKSRPSITS